MNEKAYLKTLEILGEKIAQLESDIYLKDYRIERLEAALKEAEASKQEDN